LTTADAVSGNLGDALTGVGACGGRTTANAAILLDVTQSHRLKPGDILVTRQTDPGWGPIFPLISGLVIERGGMLSHGAIIAREFGIPSVVGVKDATRRIQHGGSITVDGDRGLVLVTAGGAQ
jgi:phosphoenolpyruvate synthase/pyruvate phosphate dikinase